MAREVAAAMAAELAQEDIIVRSSALALLLPPPLWLPLYPAHVLWLTGIIAAACLAQAGEVLAMINETDEIEQELRHAHPLHSAAGSAPPRPAAALQPVPRAHCLTPIALVQVSSRRRGRQLVKRLRCPSDEFRGPEPRRRRWAAREPQVPPRCAAEAEDGAAGAPVER